MPTKQKIEFDLFSQQYDAISCDKQFVAAIAGVQGGKTFVGSVWAANKMSQYRKGVGLIVAPTYKVLAQSTLDKLFQNFPNLRKFYKEQKQVIELPSGGVVFVRSAEDPNSLEGITADWIWGDEMGAAKRWAWVVLRGRVSKTGGQIFLTTTPYNMGWLYTEFFVPWQKGLDPHLAVFTWRSIDNPHFPKAFYDAERNRLRPEEFARRYGGKFTRLSGLVYELEPDQIKPPFQIPNIRDLILGLDFGYKHYAAGAVIAVTYDNLFYLVDELYRTGLIQAQLEDGLHALRQKWPFTQIYPDPARPDQIASIKKAFPGMVREVSKTALKGKSSILMGIEQVRTLIARKQFIVFDTCTGALSEFESYAYDPDKLGELPVAEKNDMMDAIRYAIANYAPKSGRPVQTEMVGGVQPYYVDMPGV